MKTLIFTITLLSLFACTNKEKTTEQADPGRIQATSTNQSTETSNPTPSAVSRRHELPSGNDKWTYEKRIDKEGNTVYKASIVSPNKLEFNFPYAGGSTAALTIRHKNAQSYVYLEVSKGQFNRSFQGGKARIRFDDKPIRDYSFSAAENGRANIIFFDSEKKLIDQMKRAQKMIVDVEFYAQGRRRIEFGIQGLTWDH